MHGFVSVNAFLEQVNVVQAINLLALAWITETISHNVIGFHQTQTERMDPFSYSALA